MVSGAKQHIYLASSFIQSHVEEVKPEFWAFLSQI